MRVLPHGWPVRRAPLRSVRLDASHDVGGGRRVRDGDACGVRDVPASVGDRLVRISIHERQGRVWRFTFYRMMRLFHPTDSTALARTVADAAARKVRR